ncbi:DUF1102 domain-containing protein [Natrarchaeobaculum aegyptiacum]|uniref:Uncharacterized protein n=1 Tax=Natrarchaeobaculum aegyptiacum TaxID=745377 RepID=A0A2Z2I1G3_9EURY|nr:DUF1102 domain-containing protein [Natrarchaeobaculum aegyptiacum]ARS90298.1 hypothetical protein B1756_11570 [Natrarchaeobaculum aegyptiacum]
MERRKFMIGVGSTAIGASALVGASAFSVVSADRDLEVDVADDASAFLALEPESDYATTDNGQIQLDFTNSDYGADGLNENADTRFDAVFSVKNQGSQTINLYVSDDHESARGWGENNPLGMFWSESEEFDAVMLPDSANPEGFDSESPELGPGDEIFVHMIFYLRDAWEGLGDIDDVSGELKFYAET